MKKTLKEIKQKLGLFNIKYPPYMAVYIYERAYSNLSFNSIMEIVGKKESTIRNNIDDNIKQLIADLKDEAFMDLKESIKDYVPAALDTFIDLMKNGQKESVRLKAAETLLKTFGIVEEKAKVELSGSIELPTVNVITEKK